MFRFTTEFAFPFLETITTDSPQRRNGLIRCFRSLIMETTETDRISLLPDEILANQILSHLPTKYAAQTSILSNRWKFLWTLSPNLHFITGSDISTLPLQQKHINNINHCLDLLDLLKPNKQLKYVIEVLITHKEISLDLEIKRWVEFAAARDTEEMFLCFFIWGENVSLPPCLFSCNSFSILNLCFCKIELPLHFKGFSNLTSLGLNSVRITDRAVESLISACPLLEELTLIWCHDLKQLNISNQNLHLKMVDISKCGRLLKVVVDAPDVRVFAFEGLFVNFYLSKFPHLEEVDIQFDDDAEEIVTMVIEDMRQLVSSIAHVKDLTVGNWFSEFIFAEYYTYRNLHSLFGNLKQFRWSGDLYSEKVVLAIATFLGDCPVLEQLCIKLEYQSQPWPICYIPQTRIKYLRHLNSPLQQLKFIEMVGYSGKKKEIDLVRFLLKTSIVLDALLLSSSAENMNPLPNWVLQEYLYQLPKASLSATVVLSEPLVDDIQGEAKWF